MKIDDADGPSPIGDQLGTGYDTLNQEQREKLNDSALTHGSNAQYSSMSPACHSIKLQPKDQNIAKKKVDYEDAARRSRAKASSRAK